MSEPRYFYLQEDSWSVKRLNYDDLKVVESTPRVEAASDAYRLIDRVIQEVHSSGYISNKTINELANWLALADDKEEEDG
jgi:hypothetical protein